MKKFAIVMCALMAGSVEQFISCGKRRSKF